MSTHSNEVRRVRRCAAAGLFTFALAVVTVDQTAAKSLSAVDNTAGEKNCLATAIYFEARGEPTEGQEAVAQVIINRVRDGAFPDTVCGVVYENQSWHNRCQFSFACDGRPDKPRGKRAWKKAQSIADSALSRGKAPVSAVGNSTHYHATSVKPRWSYRLRRQKQIGRHIFYST